MDRHQRMADLRIKGGSLPCNKSLDTCDRRWHGSSCSSSTSLALYHSPRPTQNSSSRSSVRDAGEGQSWPPPNLRFDEWTEVFGSERLTGALLDSLTHRVHIQLQRAE